MGPPVSVRGHRSTVPGGVAVRVAGSVTPGLHGNRVRRPCSVYPDSRVGDRRGGVPSASSALCRRPRVVTPLPSVAVGTPVGSRVRGESVVWVPRTGLVPWRVQHGVRHPCRGDDLPPEHNPRTHPPAPKLLTPSQRERTDPRPPRLRGDPPGPGRPCRRCRSEGDRPPGVGRVRGPVPHFPGERRTSFVLAGGLGVS